MEIYDPFNFNPKQEGFQGLVDPVNDADFVSGTRLIDGVMNYIWQKHNGADIVLDNNIPVLTAAEALDETVKLHSEDEESVRGAIASLAIFIAIRNRKGWLVTQVPPASPFDNIAIYTRGVVDGMKDKLNSVADVAEVLANSFEVLENKAQYTGQRQILNNWKGLAINVSVQINRVNRFKDEGDK